MDDSQVQPELTRYLDDNWVPIIEKDVDGPNSLPLFLDRQNPNLGRYSACRRVTRTIYLGSAPTLLAANRGLEDRRIKLGCVQPGESVATFGDALRHLTDRATYLYVDGNRYWISTQPNVTRTAQDRAAQIQQDEDRVWEEIVRRLRSDRQRGEFAGVHIAPDSSADVPDEASVRLVVLGPQYLHGSKETNSEARLRVEDILNQKGASPRYCKNMLLFLAPDKTKLALLEQAVCQYLAWDSIVQEKEVLNLDVSQSNQATTKQKQANETVDHLLKEAYQWLLVPAQPDPHEPVEWQEIRLQGQDSPVLRASRKLVYEEHLITVYAASRLRLEALDLYLWRDVNHIDLKKLWEYLAYYLYLPRLKNEQVLLQAVQQGVAELIRQENFAYATGWDESHQRYLGLKAGEHIVATLSSQSLLVKPEPAQRQLDTDAAALATTNLTKSATVPETADDSKEQNTGEAFAPQDSATRMTTTSNIANHPKHFYGSVKLDALRLRRDVGQIADEVIQHLTSLVDADIDIVLEIQVRVPSGVPENVLRTVTENCRVLRFETQEFDSE